jgi:hypothetical protein
VVRGVAPLFPFPNLNHLILRLIELTLIKRPTVYQVSSLLARLTIGNEKQQMFVLSRGNCTKIAQKTCLNKHSPKVTESPNFKTFIRVN